MKIVKPSVEEIVFYVPEDGTTPEQAIERAARTCYKSEDRITNSSSSRLIRLLKERGHHAMLEFGYATIKVVADRGMSHEQVRHRVCSYAQESTRYVNYSKGKFNSEITVIEQPGIIRGTDGFDVWCDALEYAEAAYMKLIALGVSPQVARSVLPIGLKTEIVIGANLREWRHIFHMRCDKAAHPIIRGIMCEVLKAFHEKMPVLYEDQVVQFLKGDDDVAT